MFQRLFDLFITIFWGPGYGHPRRLPPGDPIWFYSALSLTFAIIADPGVGKTMLIVLLYAELALQNPTHPFWIFESSGKALYNFIALCLSVPRYRPLLDRLVIEEPGHPKWVVPRPLLHRLYDPELSPTARIEQQTERLVRDLVELNYDGVKNNPTMYGIPIESLFPKFLHLLFVIPAGYDNNWQLTDIRRLLRWRKPDKSNPNPYNELAVVLNKFGSLVPRVKEYFEDEFIHLTDHERYLRSTNLNNILSILDPDDMRATYSYGPPTVTDSEIYNKGLISFVNLHHLRNRKATRAFFSKTRLSLVLNELRKHDQSDPDLKPMNVYLDDAIELISEPAISSMLAELPSLYRGSRLHLGFGYQSPQQPSSGIGGKYGLQESLFGVGTLFVGKLTNFDDCKTAAEQLFAFDPTIEKVTSKTLTQHPIMMSRDEQLAVMANQIQRLPDRSFFLRRHKSEQKVDPFVRLLPQSPEVKITATPEEVDRMHEEILKRRAIYIGDALADSNNRKLPEDKKVGVPPSLG